MKPNPESVEPSPTSAEPSPESVEPSRAKAQNQFPEASFAYISGQAPNNDENQSSEASLSISEAKLAKRSESLL